MPENLQELWAERASIMHWDGELPRAAAERVAWWCVTAASGAVP